MKVVSIDSLSWQKDHPTGSLAFRYLLSGRKMPRPRQFHFVAWPGRTADFVTRPSSAQFRSVPFPRCAAP